MKEFLLLVVEGIMDALEEFFASIVAPSTKFTKNAFIYSLIFLVVSIVMQICGVPCFVSWQECVACNVLLLIIVLIDGSVRSDIKSAMKKMQDVSSKISFSRDDSEDEEINELEVSDDVTD